ncbi:MAG: hypothetical protein GX616_27585 [Planctomycetes bacterium]|nr:hypothetical protein [Planctomycetota bacterium]
MASIGGVTCTFLRGVVPALKEEAIVSRRPGMNGYEILLTGAGDSQGQLQATLRSSDAGCDTWIASIQALQGDIVTVVNDHGDTTTGVYVQRVSQPQKRASCVPGTTVTTRADLTIQVLKVT